MRLVRRIVMVLLSLFCCLGLNTGHASNGGIYTDLFNFGGANGSHPAVALTLSGGVFYGTAESGGASGVGVLFSFDPSSSTYTVLHNFAGGFLDGATPAAELTLSGGVFYGTTQGGGGLSNNGTIFSFDPSSSTYTVLHTYPFGSLQGAIPSASMTLNGGVLYGTTIGGGTFASGVIFSFDPSSSTYAVVHNFDGTHGSTPLAELTLNNGVLYGTTALGGAFNKGVIYSFDPSSSTYTVVHNFDGTNGANPQAGLSLSGNVFYGTTQLGGTNNKGVIYSFDPSSSTYTVLYNFDGIQGSQPIPTLTLSGGIFYGTTFNGGAGGNGVIFAFDPSNSTYIDLYDFDGTGGANSVAGLILNGGVFYGTTLNGGTNNLGVIFSFVPLLPPSNLTGRQKKNNSGARNEWYNDLKWQTPLPVTEVVAYNIYRDGVKIATLSPSTLQFKDHNREKGVKTLYSVTSISVQGNESSRVNITVP